jgi:cytochrome b561
MPAEPAGWSRAQRRLHWWSAGLILAGFGLAWAMVAVPLDQLLTKFLLYQLHKTLGLTALLLVLWRLLLRARRGRPAWDEALPGWQRRAAAAMHGALYGLAVCVPVLGYFVAATAPAQVPTLFLLVLPVPHMVGVDARAFAVLRAVHRAAAILLVALAALHALAAVHGARRGHGTLARMWRGSGAARGREGITRSPQPPLPPPRGHGA